MGRSNGDDAAEQRETRRMPAVRDRAYTRLSEAQASTELGYVDAEEKREAYLANALGR